MKTSVAILLRGALALALCLTLAAQATAQEVPAKDPVQDYLVRCEAHGWSGSVLLAKGGSIVLARGYGMSDRVAKRRNDADTLFEVGALTMPFTACAIMKLVEDARLGLQDPIAEYLPGVPPERSGVTVLDLLTHYSGVPSRAMTADGGDLEAAVEGYLAVTGRMPIGKKHEHWEGGYALLAGIVEVASGTSYTAFCEEHLFGPGGMKDTGFTGDTDLDVTRQAVGYDGEWAVRRAAEHPYGSYGYHYRGRGGMVTTVNDLWRFTQAFEAGEILASETVKLMEMTVEGGHAEWPLASWDQALGWRVSSTGRGTDRVGQHGHIRGFHANYQRFPEEGATLILLSNVDEIPSRALASNLESVFLGGKARWPQPPAVAALTGIDLDRLVGTYVSGQHRTRLTVERAGQGLRISRLEPAPAPLRPGNPSVKRNSPASAVAMATAVLEAAIDGDAEALQSMAFGADRAEWAARIASESWPKHLVRCGILERFDVLSVTPKGLRGDEVKFMLRHRNQDRVLKIILHDGGLAAFDLDVDDPLTTHIYRPTSKTEFIMFDWNESRLAETVRFELDEGRGVRAEWRAIPSVVVGYTRED